MQVGKWVKRVMAQRRFIVQMAQREIAFRYAGSYLGIFWSIVVPLLTSLVYIAVFSVLMRGRIGAGYEGTPFAAFYFCGFAPWALFSDAIMRSTGIIRDNGNLVSKVAFPSEILPLSAFLANLVSHAVILFVATVLVLALTDGFSARPHMLLVYFAIGSVLTLGLSYLVAALAVFVPDLGQLIPILLNLGFFATPILYTSDIVRDNAPDWIANILIGYNPFAHLAEGYRSSLLHTTLPVDIHGLVVLCATAFGTLALGLWVFRHTKSSFMDVL